MVCHSFFLIFDTHLKHMIYITLTQTEESSLGGTLAVVLCSNKKKKVQLQ